MKTLILLLLMTGICWAKEVVHPDKFGHPYKTKELVDYKAPFGSGKVNCTVTLYGRVYTCVIVKPCAPLGDNPCGCPEDIYQ